MWGWVHLGVPTSLVIAYSADPPCILGTLRLILSGFYPSMRRDRPVALLGFAKGGIALSDGGG